MEVLGEYNKNYHLVLFCPSTAFWPPDVVSDTELK